MQSLWKNPVISHVSKRIKCCANYNIIQPLHRNTNIINLSISSFSSIKKQQINGTEAVDINKALPGKPDFMEDEFENTQELEVLGLYETEISKKQAPDSRIFNPEYDPDYDPKAEDQIEVGGDKPKAQHRIIKSSVKEDVVIEMEAISSMERVYTWIVLGMSVYCGMLAVRFYFMRDRLKKQKQEIQNEKNSKLQKQN